MAPHRGMAPHTVADPMVGASECPLPGYSFCAHPVCPKQVNKNAKEAQKRRTKGTVGAAEEEAAPADVPRKWNDYTVHFEFPDPSEISSHSLIQLNEVSFKYPGRDDFGLQGLNIGIDMGSRVAIVGPNGAGKTTLMNLLAGACGLRSADGLWDCASGEADMILSPQWLVDVRWIRITYVQPPRMSFWFPSCRNFLQWLVSKLLNCNFSHANKWRSVGHHHKFL